MLRMTCRACTSLNMHRGWKQGIGGAKLWQELALFGEKLEYLFKVGLGCYFHRAVNYQII